MLAVALPVPTDDTLHEAKGISVTAAPREEPLRGVEARCWRRSSSAALESKSASCGSTSTALMSAVASGVASGGLEHPDTLAVRGDGADQLLGVLADDLSPDVHEVDHAAKLLDLIETASWRPDLLRLERLGTISDMAQKDYAEAWLWVHFLLHTSRERKILLQHHLALLR